MSRLLDKGLEQLTTILLKMGDVAEKTVSTASAHACSEIGVKWFLFLKRSQNTLIKQIHNGSKHAKTDLKPFLTILGTRMRATKKHAVFPIKS
jgi:hypothetical protein